MEKKKMNDKGFSLVELIIVIAIMAILIGVLAPQYLKFVERSRKSTDRQNADEIIRAVEIYAADPEATPQMAVDDTGVVITLSPSADMTIGSGTNHDAIVNALNNAGIATTTRLKSSKWSGTSVTLTFKVDSEGNVKVTPSDTAILSSTSGTTP